MAHLTARTHRDTCPPGQGHTTKSPLSSSKECPRTGSGSPQAPHRVDMRSRWATSHAQPKAGDTSRLKDPPWARSRRKGFLCRALPRSDGNFPSAWSGLPSSAGTPARPELSHPDAPRPVQGPRELTNAGTPSFHDGGGFPTQHSQPAGDNSRERAHRAHDAGLDPHRNPSRLRCRNRS